MTVDAPTEADVAATTEATQKTSLEKFLELRALADRIKEAQAVLMEGANENYLELAQHCKEGTAVVCGDYRLGRNTPQKKWTFPKNIRDMEDEIKKLKQQAKDQKTARFALPEQDPTKQALFKVLT
jgi:hypothetical protein